MDWSPFNDKRCDSKLCQYGSACNLIVLILTLILITGFAQADMKRPFDSPVNYDLDVITFR